MNLRIETIARSFVAAFLNVGLAAVAWAGTFTPIKQDANPNVDAYVFSGQMVESDVQTYAAIIGRGRHAVIVIDSGGGNFLTGIAMGRLTMKYRDMVTLVVDKAYSAAALWALGDDSMAWLEETSELGFHLPYVYGQELPAGYEQVAGAMMQDYLRDVFGNGDTAIGFMARLAQLRKAEGKFALITMDKFGKTAVRR